MRMSRSLKLYHRLCLTVDLLKSTIYNLSKAFAQCMKSTAVDKPKARSIG